jgi:hypothetical protein
MLKRPAQLQYNYFTKPLQPQTLNTAPDPPTIKSQARHMILQLSCTAVVITPLFFLGRDFNINSLMKNAICDVAPCG